MLNQKTLKHGQIILASVSVPVSGVRHILQWLLGSFCEPPHWLHGPSVQQHLISKACVLFSNSAVKVHDSQTYRNTEMRRERISFIFDLRGVLLSLRMGISFVNPAVACEILMITSGLEPSSKTTNPRYLRLLIGPNFRPFTFSSLWMLLELFVISLIFSALPCAGFVETFY